jgi:hypothetical protein
VDPYTQGRRLIFLLSLAGLPERAAVAHRVAVYAAFARAENQLRPDKLRPGGIPHKAIPSPVPFFIIFIPSS